MEKYGTHSWYLTKVLSPAVRRRRRPQTRTYLEYFHWTIEKECSKSWTAFAYINLNENGFHHNYESHAAGFRFRLQELDFAVKSCRSACFRSLAEYPPAFGDRKPVGWFSFALPVTLGQF